jgi:membrane protease YdiL (CAAX protease family)
VVFLVPLTLILGLHSLVGDDPFASQALVWVANVLMLVLIWLGLRLRGRSLSDFGLSFHAGGPRSWIRAVALSVLVFVGAVAAFVVGAIVAANLVGIPEEADLTGYNYMQGNLPLLLLALGGAYVVSSFGEEVVYRGFLIHRLVELSPGTSKWGLAVLLSGLLFGLAHYAWGPVGVIQTTFMGVALGAAYLKSGKNLWIMVLAHAYMDTILFVQMYLGQ